MNPGEVTGTSRVPERRGGRHRIQSQGLSRAASATSRPCVPGVLLPVLLAGDCPRSHTLDVLIANGIEMDVSIVAGMKTANSKLALDYSSVEERFLPYFPLRSDARAGCRTPGSRSSASRRSASRCRYRFSWGSGPCTSLPRCCLAQALTRPTSHASPSAVPLEPRAPAYQVWGKPKPLWRRLAAKLDAENRYYIADLSAMSEQPALA